jgi:histidine ammonia-lyase
MSAAPNSHHPIELTGDDLTFSQLYDVAFRDEKVSLAPEAIERMKASRAVVERVVASGETAYGINTGFGKLASVRISAEQVRQLQVNLVRSHSCGVGLPLSEAETRAMMLLRANALAKGLSGICPQTVETLCAMLNARVHPVIPSQGSVGASGDLAPLAHLAQVVTGEGRASFQGEILAGGEALRRAGITPVALEAKEGLSLLNGTQGMLALLSLALYEADVAADSADVAAALSLDALRGSPGAFDARIMHARAYAGAAVTARNLAHLNEGSQIRESHRPPEKDPRVQDAYSLRCTPQVHGAVRDSLSQAREMAAVELNSATDNPLVFARDGSGDIISGGNFHGQYRNDERAAYRPAGAPGPQSGAPAVSGPGCGPALGVHDRAGDRGGADQREQSARDPAFGRFHFDFRQSGRLRVDGHERGAAPGAHAREFAAHPGDRAALRLPGD